jgi:enolase
MNIQEILTIPNAQSIPKAIDTNIKIWKEIGKKLPHAKQNIESAWSADVTNEEALKLVTGIAQKYNAYIGIDFAASGFYKDGKYEYWNRTMSKNQHMKYTINLAKKFNLVYIEDPLEENDFAGFAALRKSLNRRSTNSGRHSVLICGDDLTATNPERLKMAIEKKSINTIIVKPNQIGTISDSLNILAMAKKHKIVSVVSHRSGETKDVNICKLAQLATFAKFGVAGNRKPKLDELRRMWFDAKAPKMTKLPF